MWIIRCKHYTKNHHHNQNNLWSMLRNYYLRDNILLNILHRQLCFHSLYNQSNVWNIQYRVYLQILKQSHNCMNHMFLKLNNDGSHQHHIFDNHLIHLNRILYDIINIQMKFHIKGIHLDLYKYHMYLFRLDSIQVDRHHKMLKLYILSKNYHTVNKYYLLWDNNQANKIHNDYSHYR